jgi:hypothetical protein
MNESKMKYNKEQEPIPDPKKQLLLICNTFMGIDNNNDSEIEVRFGTKGIKQLLKIDYDNVIKKLKSLGFNLFNSQGSYSLKIDSEFLDSRTGGIKSSNVRTEITGLNVIQEYCKTNDINIILKTNSSNVKLIKKMPMRINEEIIRSADFDNFNFRVSYSTEDLIKSRSKIAQEVFDNWTKSKKSFRYINRVSFTREDLPFRVDLSIVKSSTRDNGRLIKTYTMNDANVFNNPESYEIEIELLNITSKIIYKTGAEMVKGIEQITKYVLSGLQRSNFPISYKEQSNIGHEYMQMVHPEKFNPNKPIYPNSFIGPSSIALQIKNIVPINPDINVPNIRKDYVVTDKADGERNLLYISNSGKIYLINTSMSVMFTGAKTEVKEYNNTIMDGELILHNKNGKYINLYAAFDLYYFAGKDVRTFPFMPTEEKDDLKKVRFSILTNVISKLNAVSILNTKSESIVPIKITYKKFYPVYNSNNKPNSMSMFDACNYILKNIDTGLYEYNTDGLIFTHTRFGVGSDKPGHSSPVKTWEYSFKWKPAEYNTIDFLVLTKKSANGLDITTPIFENGLNTSSINQLTQYKTLILACGFDEKKHGYINPCQDIIEDKLPQLKGDEYTDTREAAQFFPSDPYDINAGLCNVILEEDDNGNYQLFTEERQVFTNETIVEFRYDMSKSGLWKWIPLRVRYDKTAEYRRGMKNFGNDYTTANSNWYSIHNPITISMITTGENIPDELAEDDVYYNRITDSSDTKGLRDFHNLFVKKLLIQKTSKKGDTLIDYACGKGGDFPKWIASNLSFVYGIDISKDNLENRLNGACARFLNFRKEFKHIPYALFVNGNSSRNIRSGQAMLDEKAVQITKAVFGNGTKERLGEGVQRQYGKGEDGFNISSCQFALHYMFENVTILHNFIRNVAECTKLNGYFIGTSYDGKTVFNRLRKKQQGDSIDIYENDKKIWQIIKDYDQQTIEDDESCIGYKIAVYQDSINKLIPEYLVNYDYLNRIMEDYGFILISRDEAIKIGLPEGSGMFLELYNLMLTEISRFPFKKNEYGKAMNMTYEEKEISFLNRYFVYKKVRTVNAEKVANSFINQLPSELKFETTETIKFQKDTEDAVKETDTKVKKLNKKLVLVAATEGVEEVQPKKVSKPKKLTKKVEIEFDIKE